MSDIVKRDTDGWAAVLPAVGDLAGKVAQTEFVPDAMRGKPAVVAAAILYGRELGLEPMTSLRSVNIIKGRPALTAEAMRAMVLAAGHDIRFQEMTSARCVIVGRRRGQDDTTTVTFTMDDAKKMGVGGGQQYAKMPRQMLAARATSELCRLIFADVIGGLISDVEAEDAEPGETLATVTPMTTARRKSPVKAAVKPPEPEAPTPTDDEPVLDDDVIEAEIMEEPEPQPEPVLDAVDQAIANVTDVMDAEIVEERVSGMAAARAALAEAKAGKPTGPITAKQLKALQAGFVACGITDRDERLAIAASLAGRPDLASANDLSAAEAKDVLDGLGFAQATENPRATLKEATS
jgi:hypothetical protein